VERKGTDGEGSGLILLKQQMQVASPRLLVMFVTLSVQLCLQHGAPRGSVCIILTARSRPECCASAADNVARSRHDSFQYSLSATDDDDPPVIYTVRSGVTMGWLLSLVTGGPTGGRGPRQF